MYPILLTRVSHSIFHPHTAKTVASHRSQDLRHGKSKGWVNNVSLDLDLLQVILAQGASKYYRSHMKEKRQISAQKQLTIKQ